MFVGGKTVYRSNGFARLRRLNHFAAGWIKKSPPQPLRGFFLFSPCRDLSRRRHRCRAGW